MTTAEQISRLQMQIDKNMESIKLWEKPRPAKEAEWLMYGICLGKHIVLSEQIAELRRSEDKRK